jgi:hypothetical protein
MPAEIELPEGFNIRTKDTETSLDEYDIVEFFLYDHLEKANWLAEKKINYQIKPTNCTSNVIIDPNTFEPIKLFVFNLMLVFESSSDAVLYKMTWG